MEIATADICTVTRDEIYIVQKVQEEKLHKIEYEIKNQNQFPGNVPKDKSTSNRCFKNE